MRKHFLLLLLAISSTVLASDALAIKVVATSDVIAMTCCGSGRVTVINTISFSQPEAYWYNVPYSHLWLATYIDCDDTYNNYQEVCCIHSGNSTQTSNTFEGANCPINAKGRSYGWAGGGSIPYVEDDAESACVQPCHCETLPGEECTDPFDPFCDPWGNEI